MKPYIMTSIMGIISLTFCAIMQNKTINELRIENKKLRTENITLEQNWNRELESYNRVVELFEVHLENCKK